MTFEQVSIGLRIAYTNLFFLSVFAYLIYKGVNHMTKIDRLKKLFVVRENDQGHKELVELLDCSNIGKPSGESGGGEEAVAQYAQSTDIIRYKVWLSDTVKTKEHFTHPSLTDGSVGVLDVNSFTGSAILRYIARTDVNWSDENIVTDGQELLRIDLDQHEGHAPEGYRLRLVAGPEGIFWTPPSISAYNIFLNLYETSKGGLSVRVVAKDQESIDSLANGSVSINRGSLLDAVPPIALMVYFEKK